MSMKMNDTSITVIEMRKCTFGDNFDQAVPGYTTYKRKDKYTYQLRMIDFNARSGLPTYVARVIFLDGSYETYWAHNINLILDWFKSYEPLNTEFEVEGHK